MHFFCISLFSNFLKLPAQLGIWEMSAMNELE